MPSWRHVSIKSGRHWVGRRKRLAITMTMVCIAGLSAGLGLASTNDSGTYIPELGVTVPSQKAGAIERSFNTPTVADEPTDTVPASQPAPIDPIPGAIMDFSGDTPFPTSELANATNWWTAATQWVQVAVYAGASPDNTQNGQLVVTVTNYQNDSTTSQTVTVPGACALTITSAPLGTDAETAAPTAQLRFSTGSSQAGTLSVANGTATLDGNANGSGC